MKNLLKLCLVAITTFFIVACDNSNEIKSDLAQLQKIDSYFETAILNNTESEKVLPIMQETIKQYSALTLETPEIKAMRDDSVSVLKDTMILALSAKKLQQEDVLKQSQALVNRGKELKKKKAELEKKYAK
ncbi:Uncharacterised protein [Phocoenobacter uteri]|uniref:Lipoprotein n=1 Tax=Phocoenobacter uteri TaxID=146806 RepID=A0A379CBR0_9PAST|nr:hypothetical protein [Phocoenobacter uteri]MDG6881775.1 hypothetical protein [Phocoenobacter uteri]SUB59812.1 Uncharacterised protein [Phocoenobacter uteri]